jgi:hypothetical protein
LLAKTGGDFSQSFLQRGGKTMAMENWIFRQNVHGNKGLLKDLRTVLTNEIQRRKPREPQHLDFRFLIPLAQWLCEQAGYTMKPEGNNPGNVMGNGDMGQFERKNNIEVVKGKPTVVPAKFANYSTMEVGTKATLNHLQERWFGAYTQILDGGSPEAFVRGLYPGHGKDYATQFQSVYTSGVRFRLGKIIEDYIAVLEDDIKDIDKEIALVEKNYNKTLPVGADALFGSKNESQFGAKKMPGVISHSMNERRLLDVAPRIDAGMQEQKTAAVKEVEDRKIQLNEQIAELKEIQKRFKEGQNLQPLGVQATGS